MSQLRIAVGKRGDAMAVWHSEDGRLEHAASFDAKTAFRPAGGAWQAAELLPAFGESVETASVALDAQGNAFAVWEAYTSNVPDGDAHFSVEATFRPVGGAWQAPVDLSPIEAPGSGHPQIAVDAQGDAMVIWNREEGPGGGSVEEAFRPAGGTWQTPVELTRDESGNRPLVALNEHGDALTVWEGNGVRSAFMPAGGTWQPASISASAPMEDMNRGNLAVNGRGDAVVVWNSWTNGFLSHRVVRAAYRIAGGAWQPAVDLSEEVPSSQEDWEWEPHDPQAAIDEHGDAVVVWSRGSNGENGVISTFKPSGGEWQRPVDLSPPEAADEGPQVGFDGRGDAIAVWASAGHIVQSALRPAGGIWQSPVGLSREESIYSGPQIAFDGLGNALAVWDTQDGVRQTVQGSTYVISAPSLDDVSIPDDGTTGQPLTFSVSPFDVWSVDGETSWNFGDGTTANGTLVAHTYAAPGTYKITLSSADTLGNATSTSRTVKVAPAPVTTAPALLTRLHPEPSLLKSPPPSSPPVIEGISQSAAAWHEHGAGPRVGTTFSILLDEPATISLRFDRDLTGRLVGHKCVASATRKAGHSACDRTVFAGLVSFEGHAGVNRDSFRGLLTHGRRLPPGRYTLAVTATDPAGQRSATRVLTFKIAG